MRTQSGEGRPRQQHTPTTGESGMEGADPSTPLHTSTLEGADPDNPLDKGSGFGIIKTYTDVVRTHGPKSGATERVFAKELFLF